MNVPLTVVVIIAAALLSIVGSLIIFNLRSIKTCVHSFAVRVDKQDIQIEKAGEELKKFYADLASCKVDCDRNTVSKEDWVRSEGFTRREIKEIAGTLHRIEGKFGIVEKIPEICGGIVREVITQLNNKGGK